MGFFYIVHHGTITVIDSNRNYLSMNKQQALTQILTFGPQRDAAFSVFVSADIEPNEVPFEVSRQHLIMVLEQYLADEIDADDLEQWANLINFRTDIDGSDIEGYLYALANPEMMGNNDNKANILRMLAVLTQS
ncbi:hypothetical protein [Photobacterium phosphoreum]|uniref:hypothetical protein n=1 Tax=Photobacterium phosphoreum TaxID=659 RepID=UPI000AE68CAB|nr:hypothetical protein [Photobacterium phosphoreum]